MVFILFGRSLGAATALPGALHLSEPKLVHSTCFLNAAIDLLKRRRRLCAGSLAPTGKQRGRQNEYGNGAHLDAVPEVAHSLRLVVHGAAAGGRPAPAPALAAGPHLTYDFRAASLTAACSCSAPKRLDQLSWPVSIGPVHGLHRAASKWARRQETASFLEYLA